MRSTPSATASCTAAATSNRSVLLDDEVLAICKKNAELGPLHMPANILGMEACREVMPNTPMALVFDTAFHATMPPHAYLYAIDYDDYKNYKIRRYGFHGTSHKYVSQEAIKYLGKPAEQTKIVTCHLGGGSSISAVLGGKCSRHEHGLYAARGRADGHPLGRHRPPPCSNSSPKRRAIPSPSASLI